MFQTVSRLRRSAITLLGFTAILLCWTNGASAFHLAKRQRPKVIYVEREPVLDDRHHGRGHFRRAAFRHDDDKKHWKKHWKHHHDRRRWHRHHDDD